ncbi:hypothetical protein MBLNU459_g5165t1 [Dothideomycetes sp. NU459]
MTTTSAPPQGAFLITADTTHAAEYAILHEQREICGWGQDRLGKFNNDGSRTLFWIALPLSHKSEHTPTFQREGKEILPVGHISLDKVDDPENGYAPDPTLVAADGSVLMITTLFVLPEFSTVRLGTFAMDQCESLAQQEPYGSRNCRAVTVTTLSSRYFTGGLEGPDGVGRWEVLKQKMPRDNALWYKRRGYVEYKDEPRYGLDLVWYGAFMRKELGEPEQAE